MKNLAGTESLPATWVRVQQILLATVGAMIFALLIAVGAKLRIPWEPVPFTMQTFFVLLAGAVLGARFGALSGALYVVLGTAGIPIFAGQTAGWSYLSGVTGGYLLGFVIAAWLVGRLLRRLQLPVFWQVAVVMAAGSGVILLCGALWLAFGVGLGPLAAFREGIVPFLPGDALKSLLAATVVLPILRRAAPNARQ